MPIHDSDPPTGRMSTFTNDLRWPAVGTHEPRRTPPTVRLGPTQWRGATAPVQYCSRVEGKRVVRARQVESIIRRYHDRLWNGWERGRIEELLAPDFEFRRSLGAAVHGRAEFRAIVEMRRTAFSDFRNTIDELIVVEDRAAVRLNYRGACRGELPGTAPTNWLKVG